MENRCIEVSMYCVDAFTIVPYCRSAYLLFHPKTIWMMLNGQTVGGLG